MTPAARAKVRAVVHMDMIASLNSASPTVLLEGAAVSQRIIDGLAAAASTYTGLMVQTSLNPFNSDHVPFIQKGVPAVLTIEGTDDANHAIHSARDTLDRLNFDLALEILRMNTAFVAETLVRT
jgi:Zn-dependent M28 family amino/carboxypeptidase